MTLKFRRILYTSFIIIFIILSAGIVFYTAGYQYQFKKEMIEKSGGILLEFEPKEVDIYVQNKKVDTTGFFDNSYKITQLLPGEYDIKIEKEGYHAWQKKLTVEGEKINFIKNIILFRNNTLPRLTLSGNITNLITSKNKEIIYFTEQQENGLFFKSFNEKNSELTEISFFKTTTSADIIPQFSLNEKNIFINFQNNNYIYNIADKKLVIIDDIFTNIKDIKNVRWSLNSDNIIYALSDNEIYQLNLLDYTSSKIIEKEKGQTFSIEDFCINNGKIYLIKLLNKEYFLEEIDQSNKKKTVLINNINYASFTECLNPYLILSNENNTETIIIDTSTKEIIFKDNVKKLSWSDELEFENYKIIYNNDFDINIYDINSNEKELITRHSENIQNASWYTDYNHVIYVYNNSINITDINKKNKTDHILFSGGEINNAYSSFDGKKIYFNGKIGSQVGLFELDIL